MCILFRDGTRESHIVTKCFEIEKDDAIDENDQENLKASKSRSKTSNESSSTLGHYGFIDELEKERKKVSTTIYKRF